MKDARRPKTKGEWGEEGPLGQREMKIPAFIDALRKAGYQEPLVIGRAAGSQAARLRDVASGLDYPRECLGS